MITETVTDWSGDDERAVSDDEGVIEQGAPLPVELRHTATKSAPKFAVYPSELGASTSINLFRCISVSCVIVLEEASGRFKSGLAESELTDAQRNETLA